MFQRTIVVASKSRIKVDAVQEVFNDVRVIGVSAKSNVAEQPMDAETEQGAANRLADARQQIPTADLYIVIENGIYYINGEYRDKAVIMISNQSGMQAIGFSADVVMPAEWVEKTKIRGFDKWTVGAVMHEAGLVKIKDDPHADFGNKIPRKNLLKEGIASTYANFKKQLGVNIGSDISSKMTLQ